MMETPCLHSELVQYALDRRLTLDCPLSSGAFESILVERGLAAGALGYVSKDAAGDELGAVGCLNRAVPARQTLPDALSDKENNRNELARHDSTIDSSNS